MGFGSMSGELLGVDPKEIEARAEKRGHMQTSMAESFNEFIERQRNLVERLMASELTDQRRGDDKQREGEAGSWNRNSEKTSYASDANSAGSAKTTGKSRQSRGPQFGG